MSEQNLNQAATSTPAGNAYGYATDEVKVNPFSFGLNAGVAFLTKFEWIPNGGKDGAEREAIDIIFKINGTDKSYRVFPIEKAFSKDNVEITDPNAQEFKDAVTDLNARMTHIIHAFQESDVIKTALARPIGSFKEFAQILMTLLPKNHAEIPLDIFLQYQWQISEGQNRTYLDIPQKMKYGRWLSPAQPGTWVEKRVENPTDNVTKALYYVNEKGEEHPIIKNGWFMNSNFANQQKTGNAADTTANASATTGVAAAATQADGAANAAKASAW